MKKVLFSALLLAGLSTITSCKKDYSCECTTAAVIGVDVVTSTKIVALSEKMKEKQGDAACAQTETQMNSLNNEIVADVDNVYDALVTTCDLK
jgi:hypothetical protein